MRLRTAAKQALEALEGGADSWQLIGPAIDALKEALVEDAMQKFTDVSQDIEAALAERFEDYEKATGMNQWHSLTDDEIKEIVGPWGDTPIKGYTRKLFDQIDAKLREKNT